MILLPDRSQLTQQIFIPRNRQASTGENWKMYLTFKSTLDMKVVYHHRQVDVDASRLYINFPITKLPKYVPDGEYEYSLVNINDETNDEEILSKGLMILGENTQPSQYNKEITYEQYTSE